jgi:hypothetical protein
MISPGTSEGARPTRTAIINRGVAELLDAPTRRKHLLMLCSTPSPTRRPRSRCVGFVSDLDGAHVVQLDTTETTGRVRVFINDGYDGDPNIDEPPGAHYGGPGWDDGRRLWKVRSLMTWETSRFRANGQADATAQYLDVVASNLLVWTDGEERGGRP